ncbi:MAG: alpha/beta hydrolase family protein, partial [Pseudonocardiaceae bacterium]
VTLRHAALAAPGERPDAVVAVSSPSRWWIRESPAMRRVHWVIEAPHGRLAGRLLGVRIAGRWSDGGWTEVPASPVEVMDRIAPTPLLLVHGAADHYFGAEHATALHRAAGGHGELWLEPGMVHGARGTAPALVHRILAWARRATGIPTSDRDGEAA